MTLAKRICLAVSEAIREHPEEVTPDDVVGCLLTTAAAYGLHRLGAEKTLVQLASQMAMVADKDMSRVELAVKRMSESVAMFEAAPKAALAYGILRKIGR